MDRGEGDPERRVWGTTERVTTRPSHLFCHTRVCACSAERQRVFFFLSVWFRFSRSWWWDAAVTSKPRWGVTSGGCADGTDVLGAVYGLVWNLRRRSAVVYLGKLDIALARTCRTRVVRGAYELGDGLVVASRDMKPTRKRALRDNDHSIFPVFYGRWGLERTGIWVQGEVPPPL